MSEFENESKNNVNEELSYLNHKDDLTKKKEIENFKELEVKNNKEMYSTVKLKVLAFFSSVFVVLGVFTYHVYDLIDDYHKSVPYWVKEDLVLNLSNNEKCLTSGDIKITRGLANKAIVKIDDGCVIAIDKKLSVDYFNAIKKVKYSLIVKNEKIDIEMKNINEE